MLNVALTPRPAVDVSDAIGTEVRIAGTSYVRQSRLLCGGWFDWLRNAQGAVIGIRFSPFEYRPAKAELWSRYLQAASRLTHVRVPPSGDSLATFFGNTVLVDEGASQDLVLTTGEVFISPQGDWAIQVPWEQVWTDSQRRAILDEIARLCSSRPAVS